MNLKESIKKILTDEEQKSRVIKNMIKFVEIKYPTLVKPNKLTRKIKTRPANSMYGSQMHDYNMYTTYYTDDMNVIWFVEYDDRDEYEPSKWELNEDFDTMFNMFGEELFEMFIKEYFGLDISEQGNKKHNWLFR